MTTAEIVEIKASPLKMIMLGGVGVGFAAGLIAMALDPQSGIFQQFVGYFGAVFFGFCAVVIAWRLVTMRGTVVTVTPDGIRDIRIAAELIPWSAVRRLSTWEYQKQKAMVLKLDPADERRLTLTAMARWTRSANRALGADGLCIGAQGLAIDYPALFQMAAKHLPPHAVVPDGVERPTSRSPTPAA